MDSDSGWVPGRWSKAVVIRQSWFVVKFADLSFFWVMNNGIQLFKEVEERECVI